MLYFGMVEKTEIKRCIKGFTLSELMLASAILLIALAGLLVLFINCIFINESNNNLVVAIADAQCVLEQLKGLAFTDIAGYEPPQFYNLNSETITLSRTIGTRLAQVTVNVSWKERNRQRSYSLSTLFCR